MPAYTRGGHFFDMESLGYVVLAAWRHNLAYPVQVKLADAYRPSSVWVTITTAEHDAIGVELTDESSPELAPGTVETDVDIAALPTVSVKGTVIPELADQSELSSAPWLGLDLRFGSHIDIAEFGFYGPIKPLIDAMRPVLGTDARGGPADHRLHDLRIRCDGRTDGSVRARFWYCEP